MDIHRPDVKPLALVVDDEPILLFELADQFLDLGYEVLQASNAEEALAQHDAHPELGVVLTDVLMPGTMKGDALACAMRARDPALSIIVCSSLRLPERRTLPPDALFVDKPLSAPALSGALRSLGCRA